MTDQVTLRTGNLFNSGCQTLVNTVNCVGVMGAGIALEFRLRHPAMFERYVTLCNQGLFDIGRLWVYKAPRRWVLNFPTKRHWRHPSKPEYLHSGLQRFVQTYAERGVASAAFPLLGASHGGLHADQSLQIMRSHLRQCEIPIEIWTYDAAAPDDLYDAFKERFQGLSDAEVRERSGLRTQAVRRVREGLSRADIRQLNQLARVRGIGDRTLERVFGFMVDDAVGVGSQPQMTQLGLDL